jgi:hypothetical protein
MIIVLLSIRILKALTSQSLESILFEAVLAIRLIPDIHR